MSFDRLYYEMRLMGKRVILAPLLLMLGSVLLAIFMHSTDTDPARFLLAVSEMLLPLVAGVIVGTVIAIDPALELQLTVPKRYPLTGALRIALIFLCMACSALVFINGTDMFKLLYMPTFMAGWSPLVRFLVIQMIWFAPLFWCTVVGFCFALVMQSRTASGALLGGFWFAEIIFKDYIWQIPMFRPLFLFPMTLIGYPATDLSYVDYSNGLLYHVELIGTALILALLGWLLLRNTERMLKGATEE